MAEPLSGSLGAGRVVEFVGLPGAGKSAIAHELALVLAAGGTRVTEPTRRLDHLLSPGARTTRKAALACRTALLRPGLARRYASVLLHSRQPSAAQAVSLTVNWLYLTALTRRTSTAGPIHILDQGLLQGLWSTVYRGSGTFPTIADVVELLSAAMGECRDVVMVRSPWPTVAARLAARTAGASRLERDLATADGSTALKRAIDSMRYVEKVMEEMSRRRLIRSCEVDGSGDSSPAMAAEEVARWLTVEDWPPVPRSAVHIALA